MFIEIQVTLDRLRIGLSIMQSASSNRPHSEHTGRKFTVETLLILSFKWNKRSPRRKPNRYLRQKRCTREDMY